MIVLLLIKYHYLIVPYYGSKWYTADDQSKVKNSTETYWSVRKDMNKLPTYNRLLLFLAASVIIQLFMSLHYL